MKIAVTGGAGFIGSHLVEAYIEAGHEVVVIDNFSIGKKENIHPDARLEEIDITDSGILKLFEREKFDVLNHHAAQINVRSSVTDPEHDARVNIVGGINLYEAARKTGVGKIIFASSGGAIYGEQKYFPADERHPKRPSSPYGVSKLANEKYLVYYKAVHGIEHAIFRYTNVYGPRQIPEGEAGAVAIFINKLLNKETPIVFGDGTQTRDFVYISDVVEANLLALGDDARGIYNCSTGIERSINILLQLLKYSLGANVAPKYLPANPGEQLRSVCSYRKIWKALGWKAEVDLETGLKHTIDWFTANK